MRQLDAHKKTPNHWIKYTDGSTRLFYAENETEAHHYFMMEGDHGYDYGYIENLKIDTESLDWMTEVDPYEGQAVHRTRSGKGAVGQAIARHKLPPNCS